MVNVPDYRSNSKSNGHDTTAIVGTMISIGAGKNRPQARREHVIDLLAYLNELPAADEGWWSGNLWKGDYRTNARWEALTVAMADVDYRPDGKHGAVPESVRSALDLSGLPGTIVHHTPRGLRAALVLDVPVTDPEIAAQLCRGLARLCVAAIEEQGITGYAADKASEVRAQLFYAPQAIVGGVSRPWPCVAGWPVRVDDVLDAGAGASTATMPAEVVELDVAVQLARLEAEGENDGSLEAVRCARRAIGLGITDSAAFVEAARAWNRKRKVPWSDDDLSKRFTDAWHRHETEGRATGVVGGKFRLADLGKILREDRAYAGRLTWDVWEAMPRLDGRLVDDTLRGMIREDICSRYFYATIPKDDLREILTVVAAERPEDRVSDYLANLPAWDGVSRFEEWAGRISLVRPSRALAASYLRKLCIGAVSRAIEPGAKFDTCVVFVGPDGILKSSMFRALTGADNFSDTWIDIRSKDGFQQIHRVWIYELSEVGATTSRVDVERVKNFLSSQADNFRAPYGMTPKLHPRRVVCVGSSNRRAIIIDADSDRRWWIIEIARPGVDLQWVIDNRDQIWAEALEAYAHGERCYLTPEEESERREASIHWKPDAPHESKIAQALEALAKVPGWDGSFMAGDLYQRLGLDPLATAPPVKEMVTRHLEALGFVRKKTNTGARWTKAHNV